MKILYQYQCETCQQIYKERAEAEACEARGIEIALFEVGDFVVTETTYGRFGWFDGDKEWVVERDKGHRGEPFKGYSLIYVITAVTFGKPSYHPHRLCYHLATKAMTGEKGHRQGFTFLKTHYRLYRVEADLDGSDLVGQLAKFLM